MKIRRPPQRHPPETIITLIDVVFFLLVFFLLVGRMDATSPFEVVPPVAETGSDMPGGGITLAVSAEAALALDGVGMARADAIERIAARLADDPAILIRVNAHHTTELRHVLPLVAELEALGARDVALVVTPNPDGQ